MDAVGGMIIAGYIISLVYISLKKLFLVLIDSCSDIMLPSQIKKAVEQYFSAQEHKKRLLVTGTVNSKQLHRLVSIRSVLVRQVGVISYVEIRVEIDGNRPLSDVETLLVAINIVIHSRFPNVERITVIPYSHSYSPAYSTMSPVSDGTKVLYMTTSERE